MATLPYVGLSAETFLDIHEAVAEAMAFVSLPITIYRAVPGSTDPLYGETQGGREAMEVYGEPIKASVRETPTDEMVTRLGLKVGANLLAFIPQRHILLWEENTGLTWALTEDMEVEYQGQRFNITAKRTDWLPVGDGSTADTFGPVFTAETKPHKGI